MGAQSFRDHRYRPETAGDTARLTESVTRFSELPLFATDVEQLSCGLPALVHGWAAAVTRFWQAGLRAGSIDAQHPLYLLDLNPGTGQLAWLMLEALQLQLRQLGLTLSPCYVACDQDPHRLDAILDHPYMTGYVEQAQLDAAVWNGADGETLILQKRSTVLHRSENPLVVLSLNGFRMLPSELCGAHCGRLMDASVRMVAQQDEPPSWQLEYTWHPIEKEASLPAPMRQLLDHYRTSVTQMPLLIPVAACQTVDACARIADNRYLLLAADPGICNEQQLRLGAGAPPQEWRQGDAPPPVNYHALSLHQKLQGTQTWTRQLQEDGLVLHAAWRDDGMAATDDMTEFVCTSLADALDNAHPDDVRRLAATLDEMSAANVAAHCLAALRLTRYDPALLHVVARRMAEQPFMLDSVERREWHVALERCWNNYFPAHQAETLHDELGILAAGVGHWRLAKECFRTGLAIHGNSAPALYSLAHCEAMTGNRTLALELLNGALELDPGARSCIALRDSLALFLKRCRETGWFHEAAARNEELFLEPLDIEHAESLFHQYRDEHIGIMTRLPELNSTEEVREWITRQEKVEGRSSYAVMHETWGFIGVVSMTRAAESVYFYFWIGTDFQDRGWGRQAAALLFEQAKCNGVEHIFTSAYDHNLRSIRALEHLGFQDMHVQGMPPDDDLRFFHRALCSDAQSEARKEHDRLRKLLQAIDSPIKLAR